MESELAEFDKMTSPVAAATPVSGPGSAPAAGWKQSMEEELALHLSKT